LIVGTYFDAGPHGRIGSVTIFCCDKDEQPLSKDDPANNTVEPRRKSRRLYL
jgi:hypothetical protein